MARPARHRQLSDCLPGVRSGTQEVQRNVRLFANHPAVMRLGRNVEKIAGLHFRYPTIGERRRRASRHHHADVLHRAILLADSGTDVLRPLPARLVRGTPYRHATMRGMHGRPVRRLAGNRNCRSIARDEPASRTRRQVAPDLLVPSCSPALGFICCLLAPRSFYQGPRDIPKSSRMATGLKTRQYFLGPPPEFSNVEHQVCRIPDFRIRGCVEARIAPERFDRRDNGSGIR